MTISEEAAINAILESPAMPVIADRIARLREEEARRRQKFYEEVTPAMKAEFVNGQVIMHSPATVAHVSASQRLSQVLGIYVMKHKLGWLGVEKAMVALTRNDFEPDLVFYRSEKSDSFKSDQLLLPPPDFVIEILSPTTEKNDRGVKMRDYAEHGVEEYWLVDPVERCLEQYVLGSEGAFVLHEKRHEGMLHCRVLTGLSLPLDAVFEDEATMRMVATIMG